ncbi:hypothetical protein HUN39_15290 [Methylocystis sp. FS]|uniref:helix-turn-helix domain-containing transcriptional regulator n=1 Tax=Methylocystis silviterrae TaxID=2743612 RepID=UPI001583F5DA|nr:hypothetical protein [Methylocystis silviterrae]NUJ81367.1 hypothetical protein [Methylocystis silviterrae]
MHGSVVSARAVLHFAGRDIDELKAAFADTIPTTGNGARSVTSSRRVGKTRYAPFRASYHLDSEDVIAEYSTATAEDENPDVLLSALDEVAKARSLAACVVRRASIHVGGQG